LWLLKITDKILISDFDGTLTVNDLSGLVGGVLDYDAVHPGYSELVKKL
jgi:phosphatidate phosphatase PAH1